MYETGTVALKVTVHPSPDAGIPEPDGKTKNRNHFRCRGHKGNQRRIKRKDQKKSRKIGAARRVPLSASQSKKPSQTRKCPLLLHVASPPPPFVFDVFYFPFLCFIPVYLIGGQASKAVQGSKRI